MSLRVVFMGTPDFAVPTLAEIVGQGHEVVACYTRRPAAAGRGMDLRPSPVHMMAEKFGLTVHTPSTLRNDEELEYFRSLGAEVVVVVAYGMILPKAFLDEPELGCLNLHASLLPRWRGAAPIQRAIMAGDKESGVAVMRMEEGLDTGPVAMVEKLAIGPDMTAADLHDSMMGLGADLMVRALAALSRGGLGFTPQPEEGVTYARKLTNDEARINWHDTARNVHDLIRGLSPFPGAFFEADFGKGRERVKVLRSARIEAEPDGPVAGSIPGALVNGDGLVACGDGGLIRLVQVQRSGKSPMSFEEFARGARLAPGAVLRL